MKPLLYLIPGTMCNDRLWSLMLPELSERFEVVYLPTPYSDSLEGMVDNILVLLPDEPVFLVGFSLGGYLASLVAIHYPQRIKKLFVIANSSGKLPESEIAQRTEAITFVDQYGYAGMSRKKAASLINSEHDSKENIVTIIRQMDKELGKEVFLNQMHITTHRPDLHRAFRQLSIPTIFYYSAEDRLVDKGWIHECVANNDYFNEIIEPGSGHMLPLEQPHKILNYLQAWIA